MSNFARVKLSDKNQSIWQNKPYETKSENLRKILLKKENQSPVSNFDEKDSLATYQKQKSQGKKFSTGEKIMIGVGIAAGLTGIFIIAASRDKIKTF